MLCFENAIKFGKLRSGYIRVFSRIAAVPSLFVRYWNTVKYIIVHSLTTFECRSKGKQTNIDSTWLKLLFMMRIDEQEN